MLAALDRICAEASQAIEEGYSFIILSDRNISAERMALSSLIACGAVHHHLVARHERTRIGIILETGEAREVHHHCLLVGYGADAINPYLAFESVWQALQDGLLDKNYFPNSASIVSAYKKGVAKSMLKVMAKMGISTLQSYKGAQIFEAVGLADEIIDRCFVGTASRVQGVNFAVLFDEMKLRHEIGYPVRDQTSHPRPAKSRRHPLASRRRHPHVGSGNDFQPAGCNQDQQRRRLLEICQSREYGVNTAGHASRPDGIQEVSNHPVISTRLNRHRKSSSASVLAP